MKWESLLHRKLKTPFVPTVVSAVEVRELELLF